QNEVTDINKLCTSVPDDVAKIIREYPEIFLDDLPSGLPPELPHDHKIELEPGAQPTVRTQWRQTQPELQELRNQLDYLLAKGFIRPSTSPFAAPILFTPKKDGGLRMCTDYRALNRVTIKSRYPIPCTDELTDNLRGARYFRRLTFAAVTIKFGCSLTTATRPRFVFATGVTNTRATRYSVEYLPTGGNLSGHFGVDKTLKALQRFYYWPDMVTDVQRYVAACPICQRMKSSHQRPTGLLQPLEPPQRPWQHITMDFVTGLPVGPSGNDAVLVVVDRLTKMAHFAPCRTTITAEETARLFISTIVRLHGIPAAIIKRSRSEVHVKILAGHVGSVRHASTVLIRVSSPNGRPRRKERIKRWSS
ncbi:hypothetical protein CLOP_g12526, partial [Closterium sp. NIES-67]